MSREYNLIGSIKIFVQFDQTNYMTIIIHSSQ